MAAITTRVTLFAVAVAVVLFVALPAKQADAQQKCKSPVPDLTGWDRSLVDYIVAYNISGAAKAEQSCYDILDDNKQGPADEKLTFNYKIGGAALKRAASSVYNADKTINVVFEDSPGQPLNIYGEVRPNGVSIFYTCLGSAESILVAYKSSQPELAAASDDVAKELSKNAADYKISRDGC